MNITGQEVVHKSFGEGVVTSLENDIITVSFSACEKRFIYPDAFKVFLTPKNNETQKHVNACIIEKETRLARERKREEAERARIKKLRSFPITPDSHAVLNIAPDESERVRSTFTVETGRYLSGYSKGKPRRAERLRPNSACLLTERPHGAPEKDRAIIGAFMVRDDYFGAESEEGIIECHVDHRILMPGDAVMPFWDFIGHDPSPRWGNIVFKYCSAGTMNGILTEMTKKLGDTGQGEKAIAFYRYFCEINLIRPAL